MMLPESYMCDAQMYDAHCTNLHMILLCIYAVYMMRYFLGTDGRTDEQGDSRSLMHVWLINEKHIWSWYMHVWCMYLSWYTWLRCTYVWCIYPWSLILIHARMMHKSMFSILDPGPDTCMCDAFINVPQSLTLMHVCMMRQILFRTDERTNKAILGVWSNLSNFRQLQTSRIKDILNYDTCMYD